MRLITLSIVLSLAAVACSDTTSTTTTVTTAATATTTTVVSAVAEPTTTLGEAAPQTTQASTTTTTAPLDDGEILITVEGGEVTSERRVEVLIGDNLLLRVQSDSADEIHIHGYDIVADVVPGEETVIAFVAVIPGVFEVELEGLHLEVLELVVNQ